ncbi:MAG: hypothetical protein U0641_09185 [Anaerolineae bacterium]
MLTAFVTLFGFGQDALLVLGCEVASFGFWHYLGIGVRRWLARGGCTIGHDPFALG